MLLLLLLLLLLSLLTSLIAASCRGLDISVMTRDATTVWAG